MLMCMESELCCGLLQLLLSTADMVCVLCTSCEVHEQRLVSMAGWSASYVVNFCWVDMGYLVYGRLWSEQC